MYAKCAADGSVDDAREVFDLMVDRNVMSWTAIIIGYVRSRGHDKEAVELFCAMIKGHVSPNLKACANLSDPCMGEQVYTHAMKLGLALVNCVGNSLISMYARSGMMEDAHKAFDMLFEKNLISYNMIVDANANNLNSEKAFELFREIEDIGIGASAFTIASLLSGAASISAVGQNHHVAFVSTSGSVSGLTTEANGVPVAASVPSSSAHANSNFIDTMSGNDSFVTPISVPDFVPNDGDDALFPSFTYADPNSDNATTSSLMSADVSPSPSQVPSIAAPSSSPPVVPAPHMPLRKSTRDTRPPAYLQDYACTTFAPGAAYDLAKCLTYSHLEPGYQT
nr:pentatricopeptide repeat-containing protein, chloroplastic [Quercus suber]